MLHRNLLDAFYSSHLFFSGAKCRFSFTCFPSIYCCKSPPLSLLQSLLDLEYCLPKLSYHLKVLDITRTVENRIFYLSYFNSTFPHKKNIIPLVSIKTIPSKTKLFSWRCLVAKNNIDLIRLVLPFFILPDFSYC